MGATGRIRSSARDEGDDYIPLSSLFSLVDQTKPRTDYKNMTLNRFILTLVGIVLVYMLVFGVIFPAFSTTHDNPSPGPTPTADVTPRP